MSQSLATRVSVGQQVEKTLIGSKDYGSFLPQSLLQRLRENASTGKNPDRYGVLWRKSRPQRVRLHRESFQRQVVLHGESLRSLPDASSRMRRDSLSPSARSCLASASRSAFICAKTAATLACS